MCVCGGGGGGGGGGGVCSPKRKKKRSCPEILRLHLVGFGDIL